MAMKIKMLVPALVALLAFSLGAASSASAAVITGCPATQTALNTDISSAGPGGTVAFNCSAATTIVFSSTTAISQSVTLDGTSSHPVTFDGNDAVQLFQVGTGVNFTLAGLTLSRGRASAYGGAMKSFGAVTIRNSLLLSNSAGSGGGAISNFGSLDIRNSTLAGNSALNGGAIFSGAPATISNSTVASNSASGGALYNTSGQPFTVTASIIANNTGANCNSVPLTSGGYNITHGDRNLVLFTCGLTGPTDLIDTNPDLKTLAENGGPTATMALPAHSKAVDRIPASAGICPADDERGVIRFDDEETLCDVGAYEHVDNLDIAVKVSGAQYSVYIDGGSLESGSTVSWHARLSTGELSGTAPVGTSAFHYLAFTQACPSGHITVDAGGREYTASGINDVTAHYEGSPC